MLVVMLRACSQCRRHFAAEPACPFCGAPARAPLPPRVLPAGRRSRAAVFAGGLLAGCYTSNPPPRYGDGPAPPTAAQPQPPPPSPPPVDEHATGSQQLADPAAALPPPVATGTIEGLVTEVGSSAPLANVTVRVRAVAHRQGMPPAMRATQTDGNGRYSFARLPAGDYVLTIGTGRYQTIERRVTLQPNKVETVDAATDRYVPTNMPMPYGAPPARTRVV